MDPTLDRELKKGSAELLILACLEGRARHGYRSAAASTKSRTAPSASTSPPCTGCCIGSSRAVGSRGRWVEAAGERRRRTYTLTAAGRTVLAEQREGWRVFAAAVSRIAGVTHG